MSTPSSFVNGNDEEMNASFWGELQRFIDLSMIYTKLPLVAFFRLRQVCKEWNRLASNYQFLKQNFKPPISSNPYFIIPRPNRRYIVLTSKGSLWTSMSLPRVQCEVSGLLFENFGCHRVFDLHTRVFHTLPAYSTMDEEKKCDLKDPLIGMVVDTTSIPYKFRVIMASKFIGTWVYDSNSGAWTHYLLTFPHYLQALGTSCIHYKKSLYIRIQNVFGYISNFETFDLEKKEWKLQTLIFPVNVLLYSDIGVWQDRWYVFEVNFSLGVRIWESKSIPILENSWNLIDCMPQDLHKWMPDLSYRTTRNKFCGQHMLVYNYLGDEKRALLYNLDKKTWDKIELPATFVL